MFYLQVYGIGTLYPYNLTIIIDSKEYFSIMVIGKCAYSFEK